MTAKALYRDARPADFPTEGGPRFTLYSLLDVKAGLTKGRWTGTLYVKNAAHALAVTALSPRTFAGDNGPQEATILAPRTIGLDLSGTF